MFLSVDHASQNSEEAWSEAQAARRTWLPAEWRSRGHEVSELACSLAVEEGLSMPIRRIFPVAASGRSSGCATQGQQPGSALEEGHSRWGCEAGVLVQPELKMVILCYALLPGNSGRPARPGERLCIYRRGA